MITSRFILAGVTFPIKPDSLSITKKISNGKLLYVITGKGCLYGEECTNIANDIKRSIKDPKAVTVCMPELGSFKVEVNEFNFSLTNIPMLIKYNFVLTQVLEETTQQVRVYKTDRKESLWEIACKLSIDVKTLFNLNIGKIKTCFLDVGENILIPVGDEVVQDE